MENELVKPVNKDCELCGTYVHIELEHLAEKGCIYCYKELPTLLADIEEGIEGSDDPLLIRARTRITNLEAALGSCVDVFDNGITVDAWDEYEKKLREVLDDKG